MSKNKNSSHKHITKRIEKRVGELQKLNLMEPGKRKQAYERNTKFMESRPVIPQVIKVEPVLVAPPVVQEIKAEPVPVVDVIQTPLPELGFFGKTKIFLTNKHTFFNGKSFQFSLLNWHIILISILLVLIITFVSLWIAGVFTPSETEEEKNCRLANEAQKYLNDLNSQMSILSAQRDSAKYVYDANKDAINSETALQTSVDNAQKEYNTAVAKRNSDEQVLKTKESELKVITQTRDDDKKELDILTTSQKQKYPNNTLGKVAEELQIVYNKDLETYNKTYRNGTTSWTDNDITDANKDILNQQALSSAAALKKLTAPTCPGNGWIIFIWILIVLLAIIAIILYFKLYKKILKFLKIN